MRRAPSSLAPLALLLPLALAGCVRRGLPEARPTLESEANALVQATEEEGALASVYVVDATTREVLYAHRPHMRLLPASTLKVVSTAAALSALGADARFRTAVAVEGVQQEGLLEGDVVLTASGDPSLGSWRFPETAAQCDQVADALVARGVREWRGSVRVRGAEPWLEGPLGPGWAWDDAAYAYGAAPSAFVFRENVVDLTLTRPEGAACPEAPVVQVTPPLAGFEATVVVDAAAERAGLSCVRDGSPARVRCVWRSTPEGCPRSAALRLAVDAPGGMLAACIDEALARRGVAHLPGPLAWGEEGAATAPLLGPPAEEPLGELVSPPLAELVRATNKESLNLYAERLGMAFARARTGSDGFLALRTALSAELARRGVAPRDLRPVDGSGLSRNNLATARGLVQVLLTSLAEPYAETLVESLPVAGVDGTLKARPLSPLARGRVRAKTGSMSNQRAYLGIAERPGDPVHPRVVFALLLSNLDEQPVLPPLVAFDRFVEALVVLPLH